MSLTSKIAFLLVFGPAACERRPDDDETAVEATTAEHNVQNKHKQLWKTVTHKMVLEAHEPLAENSGAENTVLDKQEVAVATPPPSLVENSAAEKKSETTSKGISAASPPAALVENSAAEKIDTDNAEVAGAQESENANTTASVWPWPRTKLKETFRILLVNFEGTIERSATLHGVHFELKKQRDYAGLWRISVEMPEKPNKGTVAPIVTNMDDEVRSFSLGLDITYQGTTMPWLFFRGPHQWECDDRYLHLGFSSADGNIDGRQVIRITKLENEQDINLNGAARV